MSEPKKEELDLMSSYLADKNINRAMSLADKLLRQHPNNFDCLKCLGICRFHSGDRQGAIKALERAIEQNYQDAHCHYILGVTRNTIDQNADAIKSYQRALEIEPEMVDALNNLGATLKLQGSINEAVSVLEKATTLDHRNARVFDNLGSAYLSKGDLKKATESFYTALNIQANLASAHSGLGCALSLSKKFTDALFHLEKATQLDAKNPVFQNNLGLTLMAIGQSGRAVKKFKSAIARDQKNIEFSLNLAMALHDNGEFDAAEKVLRKCKKREPNNYLCYLQYGVLSRQWGNIHESKAYLETATKLNPFSASSFNSLGLTLQELGELEGAEQSFATAVKLDPYLAEAHRHLSLLLTYDNATEHLYEMKNILFDGSLNEEGKCHVHFALGKANEDLGDYAEAYNHFLQGNRLKKTLTDYELSSDEMVFTELKRTYPEIPVIDEDISVSKIQCIPIFIVGMPRSGTTLVEQIISSHSQVVGAGELDLIREHGHELAVGKSAGTEKNMQIFYKNVAHKFRELSKGKKFISEKTPANFKYLGLITKSFPNAKIVYVSRDPLAICWSNYKNYFVTKGLDYTYSLTDIAGYYQLHANLMKFWTEKFKERIVFLNYDKLVESPVNRISELLRKLDLEAEQQCFFPHQNKRAVSTASNIQIRKPIYQQSSQSWIKFRDFLPSEFLKCNLRR